MSTRDLTDVEMAEGWLQAVRELENSNDSERLEAAQELARRYTRVAFNRLYRDAQKLISQITTVRDTYPTNEVSRQLGIACDYTVNAPELALKLIKEAHASAQWHHEQARWVAEYARTRTKK
jgi:hypothetical protein